MNINTINEIMENRFDHYYLLWIWFGLFIIAGTLSAFVDKINGIIGFFLWVLLFLSFLWFMLNFAPKVI